MLTLASPGFKIGITLANFNLDGTTPVKYMSKQFD
jgi:hypothetical protein